MMENIASIISAAHGGENLSACLTCGECVSRCFLTEAYPDMNPRKLVRKILMGRTQELVDSEFIWACTNCERCTTDCPKNLNMAVIIRNIRALARTQGKAPERILKGIESALDMGNNAGMDSSDFVETTEWLAEETAEEMEQPDDTELLVSFDRRGAEILATCCQNCLSHLEDLQARYDMPLKVKSVIELLVESIEA
jgi:heterodisulfide reductase subunit C